MPIASYGVLKGKVVNKSKGKASDKTPHYEIHVKASAKNFRVAVNVQSKESPSEVLFLVDENFEPPHADELKSLSGDFTPLGKKDEIAIDYVRSGLFDTSKMEALPANIPGKDNDLEDLVDKYVTLAMTKPGAMIYAFGSRFGPQKGKDKEFGFSPELGVHDIHMNQGNSDGFRKDDGVFQDGALLINLPQGDQWIAIFLAFQSQSFQTDDRNGHRLAAAAATPAYPSGSKPAKSAKHKPGAKQKPSAKHKATAKKASAKHKKRKPNKHH
jgi:uncharacterized protein YukJ